MQDECHIVGLGVPMPDGMRLHRACEREQTRLGRERRQQLDDSDATRLCDSARRGLHVCLYDQRCSAQICKIKSQFVGTIGWIEWCTRGPSRHGEESRSHFRAIWQYQSHPVMALHPHGAQRLHHVVNVPT
jgi:hypothetical protein